MLFAHVVSDRELVDARIQLVYHFSGMSDKGAQTEDVASIVERYRVKLDLQPWEDWARSVAAVAAAVFFDSGIPYQLGRRSGRTQHGILCALALCEQRSAAVLAICAEPVSNLRYCIDMARQSIAGLGLEIRITRDFPGCSQGELSVLYTDHHIHIKRSAP